MQLCKVIPDTVQKHPDGAATTDHKAMPPPIVVLATELDVDGHDGDFGDSEDQDDGDDG